MKKILLALLTAAVVTCGLSAPANADSSGDGNLTLTTQNLSLWSGYCGESTYAIYGSYSEAPYWNVEITVYDPRGQTVGGDYFYPSAPGTSGNVHLCIDDDLAGTYRVTAKYEVDNEDYDQVAENTVTSYFTLSTKAKYASALKATRTTYGKHGWRVSGFVTRAGKPWIAHPVQIQAHISGAWRNILTSKTNAYGRATFFATPTKKTKRYAYRLHSSGGTYTRDVNSSTFTLVRRK